MPSTNGSSRDTPEIASLRLVCAHPCAQTVPAAALDGRTRRLRQHRVRSGLARRVGSDARTASGSEVSVRGHAFGSVGTREGADAACRDVLAAVPNACSRTDTPRWH